MANGGKREATLLLSLCLAGIVASIPAVSLIFMLHPTSDPFPMTVRILASIALASFVLGTTASVMGCYQYRLTYARVAYGAWTLGIFFIVWPLADIIFPARLPIWAAAVPVGVVFIEGEIVGLIRLKRSRGRSQELEERLEVLKSLEATMAEHMEDMDGMDRFVRARPDNLTE